MAKKIKRLNPPAAVKVWRSREVTRVVMRGKVTFQCELVNCGSCKRCDGGAPVHGPYWYAYHWQGEGAGGRLVSKYVGKREPDSLSASEMTALFAYVPRPRSRRRKRK